MPPCLSAPSAPWHALVIRHSACALACGCGEWLVRFVACCAAGRGVALAHCWLRATAVVVLWGKAPPLCISGGLLGGMEGWKRLLRKWRPPWAVRSLLLQHARPHHA
eukprot:9831238-Prorocentrum_lima.AAC.1